MRFIKRVIDEIHHMWLTILHLFAMIYPYTPFKRTLYKVRGIKIGEGVDISSFVFIEESFSDLIDSARKL